MFRRHQAPASPVASTTSPITPTRVPTSAPPTPAPGQVIGRNLPATEPVTTASPNVEIMEHEPVVKEIIHPLENEEIIPIVERDRDVAEIRTIIQPIRERLEVDHGVVEKEVAVERHELRDDMSEQDRARLRGLRSVPAGRTVSPVRRETRHLAPIIRERIHPRIIEEIQPVIEREIYETRTIRMRRPIVEHIVERPRILEPVFQQPIEYGEWARRHGRPLTTSVEGRRQSLPPTSPMQRTVQEQPPGQPATRASGGQGGVLFTRTA